MLLIIIKKIINETLLSWPSKDRESVWDGDYLKSHPKTIRKKRESAVILPGLRRGVRGRAAT